MRRAVAFLMLLMVAIFAWQLVYWASGFGPGGEGVIGRLSIADGTEFRLIQIYKDLTEPYKIDFYFRLPNQPWGWCYISHDDTRWRNARLQYDPEKHSVKVYRGRELRAEYFMIKKTFALYVEHQRELPAPQGFRPPPM